MMYALCVVIVILRYAHCNYCCDLCILCCNYRFYYLLCVIIVLRYYIVIIVAMYVFCVVIIVFRYAYCNYFCDVCTLCCNYISDICASCFKFCLVFIFCVVIIFCDVCFTFLPILALSLSILYPFCLVCRHISLLPTAPMSEETITFANCTSGLRRKRI